MDASQTQSKPDEPITLYTAGTPNGQKASILLEELGIQYELQPISLSANQQKEEWFLKINPNGRIPAIVDHEEDDFPVFESGALLLYLAEKYNKFIPSDTKGKSEVTQWLLWQMGGLGPMMGQANHFIIYNKDQIKYAQQRYRNETMRLLSVMEDGLKGKEWLAGGMYSIADIACFTWVMWTPGIGISLDDYPNVKAWRDRIYSRAAVQKGMDIPDEFRLKEAYNNPEKLKAAIEEGQARLVQ